MLQAVIYVIRATSSALLTYLSTQLKLADGVYITFYDVFSFIFTLWIFIKFMKTIYKADVKVSKGGH